MDLSSPQAVAAVIGGGVTIVLAIGGALAWFVRRHVETTAERRDHLRTPCAEVMLWVDEIPADTEFRPPPEPSASVLAAEGSPDLRDALGRLRSLRALPLDEQATDGWCEKHHRCSQELRDAIAAQLR